MPDVKMIPQKLKRKRVTRVAAYTRVSTPKAEMIASLSAQVDYYSKLINSNPDWEMCGIYIDEAKTGTKDTREKFRRLISDCRKGLIDLVITKSVSRFARNTVDLLSTCRELREYGVDVFFENQNIHSVSSEGELMLTLLASIAQEQSRSDSENIKWRIRKSFENGEDICLSMMYGYDKADKRLVVNPTEAAIVKTIFSRVIEGESLNQIAQALNAQGYTTKQGREWNAYRIACMLRNEKYTGNSLLQKTYIHDHLQKQKRKNEGLLPKFYAKETHEAIIDMETFLQAQAIMADKAKACEYYAYHTTTMFTSYIRCGKCGCNYRRGKQNNRHFWNCSTFLSKGKQFCQEPRIPEDILYEITGEVLDAADFSEADLFDNITDIVACDYTLTYNLQNGETVIKEWKPKSRSASWTPEMKEQARQRAVKQRRTYDSKENKGVSTNTES